MLSLSILPAHRQALLSRESITVLRKCCAPYLPIALFEIPSLCPGKPLCGLLPQRLIKLPLEQQKEKAAQPWLRALLL